MTKIDKWYLYKLFNIWGVNRELESQVSTIAALGLEENKEMLDVAKKHGLSDKQIAGTVTGVPAMQVSLEEEMEVRAHRKGHGIVPIVKQIDTLAAEFPALTNYLYTTYNAEVDDITFDQHGTMVLGSGVYRIGSSVEFDFCSVECIRALRELGHKTVMVNYNPETVSTDFDESDRLYFDELSLERVLDIYEKETASGLIVSVGGQSPNNIALNLHKNGVNILGTHPESIDGCEDRDKYSAMLDDIGVQQPEWRTLNGLDDAFAFCDQVCWSLAQSLPRVCARALVRILCGRSVLFPPPRALSWPSLLVCSRRLCLCLPPSPPTVIVSRSLSLSRSATRASSARRTCSPAPRCTSRTARTSSRRTLPTPSACRTTTL